MRGGRCAIIAPLLQFLVQQQEQVVRVPVYFLLATLLVPTQPHDVDLLLLLRFTAAAVQELNALLGAAGFE